MAILTNLSVPIEGGTPQNTITLMPKLQNRFRVTFNFESGSIVTGNVVSVARPTLAFDPVTIETYNSRIYMPGKHTWQTIDIVIRDDVGSKTVRAIDRQLNNQIDMANQSAAKSASAFKFTTKIETLDGSNGTTLGNTNILDAWVLGGAYFESVAYGNNDYATSDAVTITITLKFDNASHIIEGDDSLSGQFVQQTDLINSTGNGGSTR